ncbi:MAG: sigma 54-interacting transcriptional regulator [Spirochaetaceae bacterium]|jgi:Nif-specific regulatory protein|nr:sigma 54-interacting transcriptional regulator [Spirochaetaceae bacterium]
MIINNEHKSIDSGFCASCGSSACELELLFDAARTLDKYVELREALGPLLSILEQRAGLKRGMVTLLDRSAGLLKIEEAYGLSADEKKRGVYRLGEGLVGKVFESGEALTVDDLSREPRFLGRAKNRTPEDMRGMSYYCVPIRAGGGVIGTLSAERPAAENGAAKQRAADRRLLEKAAALISDSAKLRERILEEQFKIDREGKNRADYLRDIYSWIESPEAPEVPETGALVGGGIDSGGIGAGGRIGAGSAIIGRSKAMLGVYEQIVQVAPTGATVLLSGESGTGKELAAAEIHRLSGRADRPLVTINCAALPESIIESELFGHEKGAFTGAVNTRKGRFEAAHTGTVFLDEVGELSPAVQVKLLRVLQEREIERLGGTHTVKVDVRLIAASNKNLEEEAAAGRFRDDLFYRLNVFPLRMPPLRERKSDILLLADYFTEKYAHKNNKLIKRISGPAIDLLVSHTWPGNVRELENSIERAVILSRDMVIHSYNLPPTLQTAGSTNTDMTTTLQSALSRLEKELILEALKMTRGNMSAAARKLGITERQIGLRVHHFGINHRTFRSPKAN